MEIENNTFDDSIQDKYDIFNSIGENSYKYFDQSNRNIRDNNTKKEYWIEPKMVDLLDDFTIVNDKFSYFLHFDLDELNGMGKIQRCEKEKLSRISGKMDILIKGIRETIILKKRKKNGEAQITPEQLKKNNEGIKKSLELNFNGKKKFMPKNQLKSSSILNAYSNNSQNFKASNQNVNNNPNSNQNTPSNNSIKIDSRKKSNIINNNIANKKGNFDNSDICGWETKECPYSSDVWQRRNSLVNPITSNINSNLVRNHGESLRTIPQNYQNNAKNTQKEYKKIGAYVKYNPSKDKNTNNYRKISEFSLNKTFDASHEHQKEHSKENDLNDNIFNSLDDKISQTNSNFVENSFQYNNSTNNDKNSSIYILPNQGNDKTQEKDRNCQSVSQNRRDINTKNFKLNHMDLSEKLAMINSKKMKINLSNQTDHSRRTIFDKTLCTGKNFSQNLNTELSQPHSTINSKRKSRVALKKISIDNNENLRNRVFLGSKSKSINLDNSIEINPTSILQDNSKYKTITAKINIHNKENNNIRTQQKLLPKKLKNILTEKNFDCTSIYSELQNTDNTNILVEKVYNSNILANPQERSIYETDKNYQDNLNSSRRKATDKPETQNDSKLNKSTYLYEKLEVLVENPIKGKVQQKFPETRHESLLKSIHHKQSLTYGYY